MTLRIVRDVSNTCVNVIVTGPIPVRRPSTSLKKTRQRGLSVTVAFVGNTYCCWAIVLCKGRGNEYYC